MKNLPIEEFILEEFDINETPKEIQNEQEVPKSPTEPLPNTDEIYQKAFKEGYEKGKTEYEQNCQQQLLNVKNEYESKLQDSKIQLEQSVNSIDLKIGEIKDKIKNIENDIVNIALEIAQKIIEKEIQDKNTLVNLIRKSLSFAKSDKVKLRVNANIAKQIDQDFKNIEIMGDPNLPIGAIIIEEDSNIIDASINTKLEELKRSLVNES
ncbi:MAG: FliH/SctL family protein [Desulfurella sp.]|uniref:FliH/SctL family protein n=1 Tax=Desulfurella sp. TaxID=1962857 RepID=UPI003D0B8937